MGFCEFNQIRRRYHKKMISQREIIFYCDGHRKERSEAEFSEKIPLFARSALFVFFLRIESPAAKRPPTGCFLIMDA